MGRVEREREQITNSAAEVSGQRDQAFEVINQGTAAIDERRKEAERQAEELGILTSSIAAENLADAYAKDASNTEQQSKRFTWGSLTVGAVAVVVSIFGSLTVTAGSSFDTVIAHAAFGLPVALLAAYVNSLATTHRREAWRLRHIELQIRTANPFLGLLDAERRKETLAALALRFCPGQENVTGDSAESTELQLDVLEALKTILREQRSAVTSTTAVMPSTAPTESGVQ